MLCLTIKSLVILLQIHALGGIYLSLVSMPHSALWLHAAGGAAGDGDSGACCGAAHRPRLPVRAQGCLLFFTIAA